MNELSNHFLTYPEGLGLCVASLFVIGWIVYFIYSCWIANIRILHGYYRYYLIYSLMILIWIISNAYFHTSYLALNGSKVASAMARFANVSACLGFAFAYLFSCDIKYHLSGQKVQRLASGSILMISSVAVIMNMIPGATVQNVDIYGAGLFAIKLGGYTPIFFSLCIVVILATLFNFYGLRRQLKNKLNRKKVEYMVFGIVIFMLSNIIIHGIIMLFFHDFAFTWIPPILSVSEMVFTGYALITSRFYSKKYIAYWLTTVLLFSSICIIFYKLFNDLFGINYYVGVILVLLGGKNLYKIVAPISKKIFYHKNQMSIMQLEACISEFKSNPQKAIQRIANTLNISSNKVILSKNESDLTFYSPYFEHNFQPIVLDELNDRLAHSDNTRTFSSLKKRMVETSACLIIPIRDINGDVIQLLIASNKNDGSLFTHEEIKTLQHIIEQVQFYINYDLKFTKYSALAYSIAHEVRNPLAQIQSQLDLIGFYIQQNCDAQKVMELINNATNSILRGNQLIDIILNEISNSNNNSTIESVDVKNLLTKSINQYGFEHKSYRDRVYLTVHNDFHIKVNEILFNFVIFNLLRNATYYFESMPDSVIQIEATGGSYYNCITFRDTGPGIKDDVKERIFDEFYSFDKINGSGLGLSYCHRVMKGFGGTITCESIYGEYTEFSLLFPVSLETTQEVDFLPNRKERSTVTSHAIRKYILVADDSISQRQILTIQLEKLGYSVTQAKNGQDAVSMCSERNYDLVILDVQMPVMNGIEAAQLIKRNQPSLPILGFSGTSNRMQLMDMENIMDGFLSKPFKYSELREITEKWLNVLPQHTLDKDELFIDHTYRS